VTSTLRSQRRRRRIAAGLARIELELPLLDLTEFLVGAGHLEQWDDHDIGKITEAFQNWVIEQIGEEEVSD